MREHDGLLRISGAPRRLTALRAKFELDYVRPSRDELLEHFTAMGLTGPYWQL
ncbi:MAG: hypothetical protein H0V04_05345 [Chloroflexi bacterium]|nr:hypothetical protein [Chloroflexota bacterium]HEV8053504.1 hypothetical protein [Candidatus Limnocylindrales bacterium]